MELSRDFQQEAAKKARTKSIYIKSSHIQWVKSYLNSKKRHTELELMYYYFTARFDQVFSHFLVYYV